MAIKTSSTSDIFIKNNFSKFLATIGNEELIQKVSGSASSDQVNREFDYANKKNKIIGDQISLSRIAELLQSISAGVSGKYMSEIIEECGDVEQLENVLRIVYSRENLNSVTTTGNQKTSNKYVAQQNLYDVLYSDPPQNTAPTQTKVDKIDKQFFNKTIQNNTRDKDNPQFSVVQVLDPELRSCFKNSQELDLFFNMISTMDLSTSMPVVRAEFLVPESITMESIKGVNSQGNNPQPSNKSDRKYLVATLNNFLYGEIKENDDFLTDTAKMINGDGNLNEYKTRTATKGNASELEPSEYSDNTYKRRLLNNTLFFSPQTMVNADYDVEKDKYAMIDKFRPFMSIMSLSFDVRPTKGLLFYKTAQMELILYDKARMYEIAPFIKPELLNTVASELILEYGWQNNSGDIEYVRDANQLNPMGEFINSLKVREKYIIVNSSYNINENGTVGISLSLSMKGPAEFRGNEFSNSFEIAQLNATINKLIRKLSDSVKQANVEGTDRLIFTKLDASLQDIKEKEITDTIIEELKKALKSENVSALKSDVKNNIKALNTILDQLKDRVKAQKQEKNNLISLFEFLKTKEDPFLDQDFMELFMGSNTKQIVDIQKVSNTKGTIPGISESRDEYISLGKIISGLLSIGIISKKNYDEVQLIFYNLNGKVGRASYLNIGSVPVYKPDFIKFLENLFNIQTNLSIEGLLTNVLKFAVNEKAAVVFGLNRFYKFNKNNSTEFRLSSDMNPATEQALEQNDSDFRKTLETNRYREIKVELFKQYYGDEEYQKFEEQLKNNNANGIPNPDLLSPSYDLTFDTPNVVLSFDSTYHISNKNSNILKIHLYDERDNPYESLTEIMINYNSGLSEKALSMINTFRSIKRDAQQTQLQKKVQETPKSTNKKEEKQQDKKEKEVKIPDSNTVKRYIDSNVIELIKQLKKDGIVTFYEKDKNGNDVLLETNNPQDKRISKIKINTTREKTRFENFRSLKENFKTYMPSLTLGRTNSALLSGNVTTSQDAKYSTVQLMRSLNESGDKPISDVEYELFNNSENAPLYVVPSQASASIIGCPLINFSQLIFLDFNTGTSVDNMYFVNGIKHSITPGKFTTDLTLVQSDLYSRFEAQATNIRQFIESIRNFDENEAKLLKAYANAAKDVSERPTSTGTSTTTSQEGTITTQRLFELVVTLDVEYSGNQGEGI